MLHFVAELPMRSRQLLVWIVVSFSGRYICYIDMVAIGVRAIMCILMYDHSILLFLFNLQEKSSRPIRMRASSRGGAAQIKRERTYRGSNGGSTATGSSIGFMEFLDQIKILLVIVDKYILIMIDISW